MIETTRLFLAMRTDRRAATALEYGLIASMIVGTIAVGFGTLANALSAQFTMIGYNL